MPRTIRTDHGPGNGMWPNGEPESVREAYDAMLAEQQAEDRKNNER